MPMKICARNTVSFLAIVLVLALIVAGAGRAVLTNAAWAVDGDAAVQKSVDGDAAAQKSVDDARLALNDAEARMDALSVEYEALKGEVDELQNQIDEMLLCALKAQQAVIDGRNALGRSAVYEYQSGGSTGPIIDIVLGSKNFSELERNLFYLDKIRDFHAVRIAEQQRRSDRFRDALDKLNAQKDLQDKKLIELEQKRAEAQSIVEDASIRLQNAQEDEAARIAELQRKAEHMHDAEPASTSGIFEGANTVDRIDAVAQDVPVEPNPASTAPDTNNATASVNGEDGNGQNDSGGIGDGGSSHGGGIGWFVGMASAYGGSTDPNTPNPGITANGAVCDDYSMGVAIPTSWENYSSYFGRTIEISYGGQTVLATINDCGYMSGGSRVLDLQPGVWKAFGFSSCLDWGVRQVDYRIL